MEHSLTLLPELAEAIQAGFSAHFIIRPNGLLYSVATGTAHEFYQAAFKTLSLIPGTLYLVTLDNGIKGTAIDFWEHYS